jgi:EmrB/QacA subfamily drug resistance transporter
MGASVSTSQAGSKSPGLALIVAIGLGNYVAALNSSVVNSILPVITLAFDVDLATIEWVMTIYLLVQGSFLLSAGRLGDLGGHKAIFIGGLLVFVVSSALCGLAPALPLLVGARALQGLGGAMLMASSPAILVSVFPPSQRGRSLSISSTLTYLGLATGPPVGGWLADALGWRSVFYLNVPVGLLALALSLRGIPQGKPSGRREAFDLSGAALYVLSLIALLLALNQGHAWGWLSAATLGCFLLGVALFALFAVVELRSRSPMLDLGLFRSRAFSAPVASAVMNYAGTSATFFMLPFYLIQGRGLSLAQTGLLLTVQPIVMAVTAAFSGPLSDRIGTRPPATIGMAVLAVGLFVLSRLGESAPFAYVAAALAVVGLGVGLFTTPNNSAMMGAVPTRRQGVASGILATARTLGNLLGLGVSGAIFSTVLTGSGLAGPAAVVQAVSVSLLAASIIALLGAVTSASRPGRGAAERESF